MLHASSDHRLISKLCPKFTLEVSFFSWRAYLQYMNLFLNLIPHHSEVYLRQKLHNSIKIIFLQKITASRSHVLIFKAYLYIHPVRFKIFSNYCENRLLQTTFRSYNYGKSLNKTASKTVVYVTC